VAVMRGPLVYCLESVDQPDVDLLDVTVDPGSAMATTWEPDLLDGVMTVKIPGQAVAQGDWEGELYLPEGAAEPVGTPMTLTAVPYYAWANRGPGEMRVWIPKTGA